jgi:hypothetical protein
MNTCIKAALREDTLRYQCYLLLKVHSCCTSSVMQVQHALRAYLQGPE